MNSATSALASLDVAGLNGRVEVDDDGGDLGQVVLGDFGQVGVDGGDGGVRGAGLEGRGGGDDAGREGEDGGEAGVVHGDDKVVEAKLVEIVSDWFSWNQTVLRILLWLMVRENQVFGDRTLAAL